MARLRFGRPISIRWNGLLLEGPANTVFEIPDEFYEEFNQDIAPVEPTLVWLDTDEAATLRGRVTALESAGGDNAILKTIVDAKGDLIVGTAADTVNRLPGSGTNGHVLTYDSAETTGLKWAAAPGSGGGASVGTATPLALGTASAGDDATASREDHVHPTTGLALSGHNHDSAYAPLNSEGRADIVYEVCKNSSGTTIPAYSVVYINGADGTNPTIALADADSEATSSKTLGFTETSSSNGDQVTVLTQGRLTGVDTSAASTEGVAVWLSSTAGGYVFGTPPAEPAHAVYLGVVTKKNVSTGEIFVKVQNGYELDELHDVSAGSPSNGDILQYNSTSGMWEKESLSTAGIAAASDVISKSIVDAKGDLIVATASDTVARLPVGATTGHVLSVDPAEASGLKWVAQSGGITDSSADTLSNKTINLGSNTVSGTLAQFNTAVTDADLAPVASPTFTGTVVLPSTTSIGNVTSTEIGYLDGVTSAIQTQINAKANLSGPTFTGTVTLPSTTSIGTVSSTELGYLDGVTSAIQTQINSKVGSASPTFTGNVTINATGDLRLADTDSSHWVALQAPSTVASNVTWTLPSADGTIAYGANNTFLRTNGSGTLLWADPTVIVELTGTGTWTVPDGVSHVDIFAVGAGGGGGSGGVSYQHAGADAISSGGGGGGGSGIMWLPNVYVGNLLSVSYSCPTGGAGGASINYTVGLGAAKADTGLTGNAGASPASTTFGSILSIGGGSGGGGGIGVASSTAPSGGAGGNQGTGSGHTKFIGGVSANGAIGSNGNATTNAPNPSSPSTSYEYNAISNVVTSGLGDAGLAASTSVSSVTPVAVTAAGTAGGGVGSSYGFGWGGAGGAGVDVDASPTAGNGSAGDGSGPGGGAAAGFYSAHTTGTLTATATGGNGAAAASFTGSGGGGGGGAAGAILNSTQSTDASVTITSGAGGKGADSKIWLRYWL